MIWHFVCHFIEATWKNLVSDQSYGFQIIINENWIKMKINDSQILTTRWRRKKSTAIKKNGTWELQLWTNAITIWNVHMYNAFIVHGRCERAINEQTLHCHWIALIKFLMRNLIKSTVKCMNWREIAKQQNNKNIKLNLQWI